MFSCRRSRTCGHRSQVKGQDREKVADIRVDVLMSEVTNLGVIGHRLKVNTEISCTFVKWEIRQIKISGFFF